MAISRGTTRVATRSAPEPTPVPTAQNPSRASQFVLTSKIVNAPQTAFLATKSNTKQQLRVAKQAQVQDPRVVLKSNKLNPLQVALPRGTDNSTFRGLAVSFRSQNQAQLPSTQAKALPNASFLALNNRTIPRQAKTQAAAAKLHNLLA